MRFYLIIPFILFDVIGVGQQLALPPENRIPDFPAALPEQSVAMGAPEDFEEVKMDFPMFEGVFEPTWESIHAHYGDTPSWLREAKFGFWVHFGPQAEGMSGDWYAKRLYEEGEPGYANHIRDFGHPATPGHGYKDLLQTWNPAAYDPESLVKLYHDAGARFLFIQGVHHDNFDLWDSAYQPWNSVNMGPKRDLLGEWVNAVRRAGMYYGITFHHEYTWWWWESAFRSDSAGVYAGIPYDGSLVYAPLSGQWWEAYDLRMLYGVNFREYRGIGTNRYAPDRGIFSNHQEYARWYAANWALRILDAINKYDPDFIYTDGNDTQPFSGKKSGTGYKCDAAQRVIASYYNQALSRRGKAEVFSIVKFHPAGRRGIVTTFENRFPKEIKTDQAWIGENPVGDWYYGPGYVYDAGAVIRFLLECVSRDGCYAVSIPIRPDGSLDPDCREMLRDIGDWMKVNGVGIYGSRAWKTWGEGKDGHLQTMPAGKIDRKLADFRFNDGDFRFTRGKDGALYVYCMTVPEEGAQLSVVSLGKNAGLLDRPVQSVELLGCRDALQWTQRAEALHVVFPGNAGLKTAVCFRIE
jgi:alpha-L-fucosidase